MAGGETKPRAVRAARLPSLPLSPRLGRPAELDHPIYEKRGVGVGSGADLVLLIEGSLIRHLQLSSVHPMSSSRHDSGCTRDVANF